MAALAVQRMAAESNWVRLNINRFRINDSPFFRQFCTALGALIVPMSHSTVWDLTGSNAAALIASSYLLFDVGMLTLNQYILLDPILLCFMTASVMGMVKISKATHQQQTFTAQWWWWLAFTGAMLACTISVKFVGLFVVLLVGLHTVNDLWIELGDLTKPIVRTRVVLGRVHEIRIDFSTVYLLLPLSRLCGVSASLLAGI